MSNYNEVIEQESSSNLVNLSEDLKTDPVVEAEDIEAPDNTYTVRVKNSLLR
jgi:hypothetical protein